MQQSVLFQIQFDASICSSANDPRDVRSGNNLTGWSCVCARISRCFLTRYCFEADGMNWGNGLASRARRFIVHVPRRT